MLLKRDLFFLVEKLRPLVFEFFIFIFFYKFPCFIFYTFFYFSYAVAIGLVDILARRCMKVREVVENRPPVVLSLLATLGLLTKIAELCPRGELFFFLRILKEIIH